MRRLLWPALTVLAACSRESAPLTIERHPSPDGLRLVLRAEAGSRINARLKPALELADGRVLRFDAARLSPDSAYYAEPPVLTLPAHTNPRGRLRASVCNEGEHVCRIVTVQVG